MSVSLILPYYNPSANWAKNVVERYGLLQSAIPEEIELILVNDGSVNNKVLRNDAGFIQDNIRKVIFISYDKNRGKGYAVRKGVNEATGDIIMYTDIDFPYNIESICRLYDILKFEDVQIAIGVKDAAYYDTVPQSRKVISKMLRWMIRTFFSIPFTDTQCGLKGFKKAVKPEFLDTTVNRYLFDLEFIRNSYKKGYVIRPVPIKLNAGIEFSKVNYRILIPEVFNLVKLMFR